jgi:hypothetical protein
MAFRPPFSGKTEDEETPIPDGIRVAAHIEGLCGEERRLMEIADHQRSEHEHARLKAIEAELDRAFEHLAHRAERKRARS